MGKEPLSPQLMHKLVFTVLMHGLNDAQSTMALQVLTDAFEHENSGIRELAVVAIADLPVPPNRRVQALVDAMKDPCAKVRRRAARALADQGPASQVALPHLTNGLSDPDASVRRDCAGAISRLGPAAHPAAAKLVTLLGEPDPRTRAVTVVALRRIGRGSIPALLNGVQSPQPPIRAESASLLGRLAPGDSFVAGFLRPLLHDSDPEVRTVAEDALKICATIPAGPPTVIRNELPAVV